MGTWVSEKYSASTFRADEKVSCKYKTQYQLWDSDSDVRFPSFRMWQESSLEDGYLYFGGIICLPLQGTWISTPKIHVTVSHWVSWRYILKLRSSAFVDSEAEAIKYTMRENTCIMNWKWCGRKWSWPNLNLPERSEKKHGTLSESSPCAHQDSNSLSPKTNSGSLPNKVSR